jgi:hypothetical protein
MNCCHYSKLSVSLQEQIDLIYVDLSQASGKVPRILPLHK